MRYCSRLGRMSTNRLSTSALQYKPVGRRVVDWRRRWVLEQAYGGGFAEKEGLLIHVCLQTLDSQPLLKNEITGEIFWMTVKLDILK